ncbi:MAG TPA: B-box zinc finger protein [Fimbriimonadales bacterium]|nr:B-box zinc finger protein [Fimbriimonadales bacterium]
MTTEQQNEKKTTCAKHPNVETTLRCSRCETPICPKCAVLTSVGYRCPDCGKEKSAVLTVPINLLLPGCFLGFILGFFASYFIPRAFGFFLIFLGAIAGGLVGEIVSRVIRRKSSIYVWGFTSLGFFVGAMWEPVRRAVSQQGAFPGSALTDQWALLFALFASVAAWERLR